MKRCLRGWLLVGSWMPGLALCATTWCFHDPGDNLELWTYEVAPEPVDTAYASNALWQFGIHRTITNWEQLKPDTVEDLLKPSSGTTVHSDGSSTSFQRSVVKRPGGYWSRQSFGFPWVYNISQWREETVDTRCTPTGGCTTRYGSEAWASCISRESVPYRISIENPRLQVEPSLEPLKFKFTLTHDGLLLRNRPMEIRERLKKWFPHGDFEAVPTPNRPYGGYTDQQGQIELAFRPKALKPVTIPMSFTCEHCENSVDAWVVMQSDIVIGFFNGVGNTRDVAQSSMDRLKDEFGSQYKDAPLKYDWFYNQTSCGEEWYEKGSCLEDVAEVFEQRSQEMGGVFVDRWETFWDVLAGRHAQATSFTGRLMGLLGDGSNALLQSLDATASALLNQLTRETLKLLTLFADSPTYENRADHMTRLWRHADDGSRMLLVAHSQGNLFVNSAYDALKAAKPGAHAQVVHVAPASPTLRGEYVLADIDLVINALRISGLNSVPSVNIALPLSSADSSGHGFEPTYLDKTRATHGKTRSLIGQSLDVLTQ